MLGERSHILCLGFPKAGTTALHRILSAVLNGSVEARKELFFFDNQFHLGFDWYYSQFHSDIDFYLDFTPTYILSEPAMELISQSIDKPKIIIMVRHPVDRHISHFKDLHNWVEDRLDLFLEDDVRINRGRFSLEFNLFEDSMPMKKILKAYEIFGRESVFVGFYEQLVSSPAEFLSSLGDFLGISINCDAVMVKKNYNPAGLVRSRRLQKVIRSEILRDIYSLLPRSLKYHSYNIYEIFTKLNLRDDSIEVTEEDRSKLDDLYLETISEVREFFPSEVSAFWDPLDA